MVMYDKIIIIVVGNEFGSICKYNWYYLMNKIFVYNDEERGDMEEFVYYLVGFKVGMGDYYVVDIFRFRVGLMMLN